MLLYILKFKEHDLVKIGITTSFAARLSSLQKELKVEFELMESYIITGRGSSQIQALEKQLLNDLIKDTIPEKHPYSVPQGSKMKDTEIRLTRRLNLVLNLLQEKIKALELNLRIYEGIDISEMKSDIIPEGLIPYHLSMKVWEIPEISNHLTLIAAKEGKSPELIYAEVMYQWLVSKGKQFNTSEYKRKPNCFRL